jgi:DNA end-binding protein Ku
MAPRAYWKGFLRLSLVSCPIALYPATSEREKIHFHQINRKTGNRIQYRKVDSDTGREVDREDIIKAYEKSKGEYIPVEPEELEAVAIESIARSRLTSSCRARKSTNFTLPTRTTSSRMEKPGSRPLL